MQPNPTIKFTFSQIIEASSEEQKYLIRVQAHLSAQKSIQKSILVNSLTKMTDIKANFSDQFFPNIYSPPSDQLAILYNNIQLDNRITITRLIKCIPISKDNINQTQIHLQIRWPLYKKINPQTKTRMVIVWVDSNFKESKKTYDYLVKNQNIYDQMQLIQLQSNQALTEWITAKITQIKLWNEMNQITFLSNMNRPPSFKQEGIETLRIVNKVLEKSPLVFYIGNKSKCEELLQQNCNKFELACVEIIDRATDLSLLFQKDYLNRLQKINLL